MARIGQGGGASTGASGSWLTPCTVETRRRGEVLPDPRPAWSHARAAAIVAHPDDEILWAGGTILTRSDLQWDVVTLKTKTLNTFNKHLLHAKNAMPYVTKNFIYVKQIATMNLR